MKKKSNERKNKIQGCIK